MKKALFITLIFSVLCTDLIFGQLSANTSQTNPTCISSTGVASVTASGGSNYTYKWSTGATTNSVSGLTAGTYTVTVYSSNSSGYTIDTIYKETFDETTPNWTLNTSTGTNGDGANTWMISDEAGGAAPGQCTGSSNGDKTLYITSQGQDEFYPGCTYYAGGLGDDPTTNEASESANIAISGGHNIMLAFDFTAGGDNSDKASLLYSINGGTNYTTLNGNLKTNNTNSNCVVEDSYDLGTTDQDGTWAHASYLLPSTVNNVSNFRIQFNWTNNNDDNGSDPSIAVNNVLVLDSIPGAGAGLDSIVKTINLVASGSAGPDSVVADKNKMCASDSAQLCVTSVFSHYQWNTVNQGYPGDTTQCIYVKNAGGYIVTVTDVNGCTAISNHGHELAINVFPVPSVSIVVQGDTLASFGQVGYQWIDNGTPIQGATQSVYIAKAPGAYEVEVTDTNGCKTISTAVTTGIRDLTINVGFELYPNPVSTGTIELSLNKECVGCDLEVFDVQGRKVYASEIKNLKTEIDVSALAKGTYMIKVADGVKKFIKE